MSVSPGDQVWCLTGMEWPVARVLAVEGFFPFTYLIVSLRIGYLKAVSTSYCRLPAPQKSPALLSSVHYLFCSTEKH